MRCVLNVSERLLQAFKTLPPPESNYYRTYCRSVSYNVQLTCSELAGGSWFKMCLILIPKLQCTAGWPVTLPPLLTLRGTVTHQINEKQRNFLCKTEIQMFNLLMVLQSWMLSRAEGRGGGGGYIHPLQWKGLTQHKSLQQNNVCDSTINWERLKQSGKGRNNTGKT